MKRIVLTCLAFGLIPAVAGARYGFQTKAPKGTLRHTVAFNFKGDVSQDAIDKVLAETRATLPTIRGAANIIVGSQTSNWTKYKYGISIDFVNKEAKEAYATSPQSKKLHEQYKPLTEDEVVVDIVSE
jgi:hypothetical protein